MPTPTHKPVTVWTCEQFVAHTTPVPRWERSRDLGLIKIDWALREHDSYRNTVNPNPKMIGAALERIEKACDHWLLHNDLKFINGAQASFNLRYLAIDQLRLNVTDARGYLENGWAGDQWPEVHHIKPGEAPSRNRTQVTGYKGLLVDVESGNPVDTGSQLCPFAIVDSLYAMYLAQPVNVICYEHQRMDIPTDRHDQYVGSVKVTKGKVQLVQNGSADMMYCSLWYELWKAAWWLSIQGTDLSDAIAVANYPPDPKMSFGSTDIVQVRGDWTAESYRAAHLVHLRDGATSVSWWKWKYPGGPSDGFTDIGGRRVDNLPMGTPMPDETAAQNRRLEEAEPEVWR